MSNQSARRKDAVDACVARFVGKLPAWGSRDCLTLARHVLHKMGRKVGKTPRYTTEMGALRAMKKLGFSSLAEAVDAQGLPRISPASALPGDIVALAADDAFGCALTVYHGNGKVIGFAQDRCHIFIPAADPKAYICAWRV